MNLKNIGKLKVDKIIVLILLFIPIIFYGWRISLRSPLVNLRQQLFSGVIYQRKIYAKPRPYIANIVEIDLNIPNIIPFVSSTFIDSTDNTVLAMTTSEFIQKYNLNLAINGSFFYPFSENTPWDFYPHSGDAVNPLGESIADRKRYGTPGEEWNVLCFSASNIATIETKSCPTDKIRGIAGKEILLEKGSSIIIDDGDNYARSGVGTNATGNKIWLVVVDGKQPFYSEGVTLKEFADLFISLGCDRALNLDGGGSSTLVMQKSGDLDLLNAPIHTKIPMRERPVANHLGFKVNLQ